MLSRTNLQADLPAIRSLVAGVEPLFKGNRLHSAMNCSNEPRIHLDRTGSKSGKLEEYTVRPIRFSPL